VALIDRLIGTVEPKIPVHQFMAALGEYKRAAPNVTLSAIQTQFGILAGEVTDLTTLAGLLATDVINQETIHDVLLLGEVGIYDANTCVSRILTAGSPNIFSILLRHRIDALNIGLNDFVTSGCAVTQQGSPNMTLAVAKGSVMSAGVLLPVTAGNVTIAAADTALPRLDLVVADNTGAKQVRKGTPAAEPTVTGYQTDDVPLTIVYVAPNVTSIVTANLTDVRVTKTAGPLLVGKLSTAVVKNNTLAQQTFISLTLPSGLFLAGKVLRIRCGGSMLFNSGTPTATLLISYGGTTMFSDVSTAATADTDRMAWCLDFNLVAQSNTVQALNGLLETSPVAAKTAPTTGIGDMAVPASVAASPVSCPLNGSAAIDSDAADRILLVAWTMNTANAADEIRMEYATAELM